MKTFYTADEHAVDVLRQNIAEKLRIAHKLNLRQGLDKILKGKATGDCKQCGACCREQGSPPCMPECVAAMPAEIATMVNWFSDHDPYRYDHRKECYFLSIGNTCLIYDCRPEACRDFQPGRDCPEPKEPIMDLLELRNAVQDKIEQIEGLEVSGSGQTVCENPVADIGFDLNGSAYRLTLQKKD